MATTVYSLGAGSTFNKSEALAGRLCIIVASSYDPGEHPTIDASDTTNFKGSGFVKVVNNTLTLVVDNIPWYFDINGIGIGANSNGYKLYLGVVDTTGITVHGNYIEGIHANPQTRSGANSIIIDNLNPLDQFAIQALQSILNKVQNPTDLSDSDVNRYCQAAYQWASNMMVNAANLRNDITDNYTQSQGTATVSSLDSNTEKLLNNLIIELASTNKAHTDEEGVWSKVGQTSVNGYYNDTTAQTLPKTGGGTCSSIADAESDGWSWKASHYSERQENTIVGFQNLINATNLSTLNKAVDTTQGSEKMKVGGSVDIGAGGLGRDSSHPVYISGGGGGSSTDTVHIGSSTNGRGESSSYPFVIKGGDSYTPTGGTAINDVVKVAIVAGGGGGSATVDKSSVPTVQPSLTYTLEHVLVFQYDTYSTSLRKVALGDLGVPVLQTISDGNFPSYSDIKKGYYYKFITTNPTVVDIDLPAAAVPNGDIVNIVMFSFELDNTANFSVTVPSGNEVLYRESYPGATLAQGTYEIDCLADGNRWIIGVTKLVSQNN